MYDLPINPWISHSDWTDAKVVLSSNKKMKERAYESKEEIDIYTPVCIDKYNVLVLVKRFSNPYVK